VIKKITDKRTLDFFQDIINENISLFTEKCENITDEDFDLSFDVCDVIESIEKLEITDVEYDVEKGVFLIFINSFVNIIRAYISLEDIYYELEYVFKKINLKTKIIENELINTNKNRQW
jgi:hypothetical protein